MKIKVLVIGLLLGITSNLHAGQLITGATITAINNVSSDEDTFTMHFEDGSGYCLSEGKIKFPVTSAVSKEAHARAYSALLTAFMGGLRVKVHNYGDDDCAKASYVYIYK